MSSDAAFTGSIPGLYDRCLGPLLFEPYALDMAERVAGLRPGRILETAAGTGIVTAALAAALPDAEIVATDLNQAMLDVAAERVRSPRVSFRAADAQQLPYEDDAFDALVCQFGFMFFPDRAAGYGEARRVLRPGGALLFNVWDSLAQNPIPERVEVAVAALFPGDPPSFLARVPFGYADVARITDELRNAGFGDVRVETVTRRSRGIPSQAAEGLCLGSPLRAEIEARDPARLGGAVAAATAALAELDDPLDQPMAAHVFVATV
ncbi:class I SAM-dependent methyltransferase [Sphingomonas sp.]|jgi:ubiquinone/menaquinone biosynthesis C-methylase UbiE|uniref:class I SAM-dependent methyltransferase n=1 Tax=Sphingomonas sp. TaxID=28214 RepID=UPI002DF60199|nr:methyltransferase domain-containing protein [Sphingomonas sp.]